MARPRDFAEKHGGWLITFADLVTLLLALFVLIFSMSSLDSSILRGISSSVSREMPKRALSWNELKNTREAARLIRESPELREQEGRIKDLLFPYDLLPPGFDKGTLEASLRLEERGEGVAFIMPDSFLFEAESSRISEAGRTVLSSLAQLLEALPGDLQVIGFYAGPPRPDLPDDYAVASRHALSALGVFINRGIDSGRLSLSAYGADMAYAGLEAGAAVNRLEILFKSARAALQSVDE